MQRHKKRCGQCYTSLRFLLLNFLLKMKKNIINLNNFTSIILLSLVPKYNKANKIENIYFNIEH